MYDERHNMIFDRTSADVNNARKIREEKIKKFIELNESEYNTLERGTITINTLNRIENKQAEVKTRLNDMGYFNAPIINKTWNYVDVFTEEDFERIVKNNSILRNSFYALKDSPVDAIAKYHYSEINAIEKILLDISSNIEYTINKYRRCGKYYCGE